MALPLWKPNFLSLNQDASRSDPKLVTLDGVTIAKTRFLVTKLGSILMARTDGMDGTDAHTWFFKGLYTISPSGNKTSPWTLNTNGRMAGFPSPRVDCSSTALFAIIPIDFKCQYLCELLELWVEIWYGLQPWGSSHVSWLKSGLAILHCWYGMEYFWKNSSSNNY